jgi:uncharacterized membrane protein YozB (DUF420 family)
MDLSFLPGVNAALNGVATILLIQGRRFVKAGRIEAHRNTMLASFAVSSLFLLAYVLHKASKGFENTPYDGTGLDRILYLVVLATHVPLAMSVPALAAFLIFFGLRGQIGRHRRLARIAWPIWLYVSVTGVVIYVMLYHLDPIP